MQLLSQCGCKSNCLSRSVPEIQKHVAGTLSKRATNTLVAANASATKDTNVVVAAAAAVDVVVAAAAAAINTRQGSNQVKEE